MQSPDDSANRPDHELHIVFVNGSSTRLVMGEMVRLLLRRELVIVLAVLAGLISVLSPPLLRGGLLPGAYAAATVVQLALFPPVFMGLVLFASELLRNRPARIFEPVITLLATVLVSHSGLAVAAVFAGEVLLTRTGLIANILLQFAFWEGIVTVNLMFIAPAMQNRARLAATPARVDPPTGQTLRVGRLTIRHDQIRRIETDDHYLILHGDGEEFRVMAKLSDLAAQLSEHGMIVHRSHWVAFGELGPISRNGRTYSMVTRAGTTVPVSRDKRRSVTDAQPKGADRS